MEEVLTLRLSTNAEVQRALASITQTLLLLQRQQQHEQQQKQQNQQYPQQEPLSQDHKTPNPFLRGVIRFGR